MEKKNQLVAQLFDVLSHMNALVQQLLISETKKYDAVKNMDIETIITLNDEETFLIQQMDSYEFLRNNVVTQLAEELNCSIESSISDLADFVGDTDFDLLLVARQLKDSCEMLSIMTSKNDYILQANAELIHHILEATSETQEHYDHFGNTSDVKSSHKILDQMI